MEKTRLSGRVFVSRFVFLYLTLVGNFWNLAALRWHLLNGGWLSLFSDKTKFYFSAKFWLKLKIVTLNLRYYLFVALCLISPDFATCSRALHEHVIGDVIKMLRTFARLVLSTLTPCFSLHLRTSDIDFVLTAEWWRNVAIFFRFYIFMCCYLLPLSRSIIFHYGINWNQWK